MKPVWSLVLILLILCLAFLSNQRSNNKKGSSKHSRYSQNTWQDNDDIYVHSIQNSKTDQEGTYDLYVLALSWQTSLCSKRRCSISRPEQKDKFNLHGLWPSSPSRYSSGVQDCPAPSFNSRFLPRDLKDSMRTYWSALFNEEDWFWGHEWSKHGSCWRPSYIPTKLKSKIPDALRRSIQVSIDDGEEGERKMINYFKLAIELSKLYNPYSVLLSANIRPSSSKPLTQSQIVDAYRRKLGVSRFNVICSRSDKGESLLEEIRLCLSLSFNPEDCRSNKFDSCDDKIWYLP